MSKIREKPANATRRVELTVTDTTKCKNCDGRGIEGSGIDDYGLYYSIRCKRCFCGMIIKTYHYKVRENKNGTFTIIK